MLSEFHRGVALIGVVKRGLTALSKSLLAGDSYFGGMTSSRTSSNSKAKCCSLREPVKWLSGILHDLSSPDGRGILLQT